MQSVLGWKTRLFPGFWRWRWLYLGASLSIVAGWWLGRAALPLPALLLAGYFLLENRRLQGELKAGGDRWQFALEGSGDGIWDWDLQRNVIVPSPHLVQLLALPHARAQSPKTWLEQIHPADKPALQAMLQNYCHNQLATLAGEFRWRDGEGGWRWLGVRGMAVGRNAQGLPCHLIGTLTDISERKQAQLQLASNRTMLASIIDSAMDGIITTDQYTQIVLFNRAAEQIFGYSAHEVLGRPLSILLPERSRASHTQKMQSFGREQDRQNRQMALQSNREVRGLRSDDTEFPAEASISHTLQDQKSLYTVVLRDITQRKLDEQHLRELNEHLEEKVEERTRALQQARKQAEAASRSKSDFLANMSHEIRTPLNSVLGMSYLALEAETSPKQRDYLQKIYGSGKHLLDLINDILDFSKIEAGKLELEACNFSLRETLGNVLNIMQERAEHKGLRLVSELDARIPDLLHGDSLRLGQILINLCSNAIKFTEHGLVTLSIVLEQAQSQQVQLRFAVRDSGIGMSAQTCGKLFKPFEQSDSSTTRKYGGTGLGLAICKQLVDLMAGEIGVNSREGEGSEFWMMLSLTRGLRDGVQQGQLDLGVSKVLAREKLAGKHLLLADDHPFNLQVGSELLEAIGVSCRTVEDGEAALAALESEAFDGVLMDVQMPLMDGYTASSLARERGCTLPIIAMTANATADSRQYCVAAGMNDFVSKPVRPDLLYATLCRCLLPPGEAGALLAQASPDAAGVLDLAGNEQLWIDLDIFAEMVGSDPERMRKYALRFVQSIQAGLAQVHSSLAQGDWSAISAQGHKLKSVALTVGAQPLGDLLSRLEQVQMDMPADEVKDLVTQCQTVFMHTQQQACERLDLDINI